MLLLIKLLLAHLIGDFLLQPKSWVISKEKNGIRSTRLYLHIVVHFALMLILLWDVGFVKWAALIAVLHLIIDVLKVRLQKKENRRIWFFADQLAHFISIVLVYCWITEFPLFDSNLLNDLNYLLLTMIVFLTFPASMFIRMFIAKWSPHHGNTEDESLMEAGKYIGIAERLFVFVFVLSGHWEAIGFLMAAKSVFRFGDLKESKDRKLTEYMMIGTLASFGIALFAGMLYNMLIFRII